MKKISVLIFLSTFSISVYAQKWEIIAKVNSGIFHFAGEGANILSDPYNRYGSKGGLSYGIGLSLQRKNTHHIQCGLDVDIESLQSRALFNYQDVNNVSWRGRTLLRHNFFTLSPYLDYTMSIRSISIYVKGGVECALNLGEAIENYKSNSSDGQTASYIDGHSTTAFDLRHSFQLVVIKKKLGMGFGYSTGIMDYKLGWKGGTNLVFSRYLKIGLQYRLSK